MRSMDALHKVARTQDVRDGFVLIDRIASLEAERKRLREILQLWYETDCPDMTCGSDGWTCELCTQTQAALASIGGEGKNG